MSAPQTSSASGPAPGEGVEQAEQQLQQQQGPLQQQGSQPPGPSPVPSGSASLYVGELDPSVTEAMLFEMFNMVGPVQSIRVCRDSVTRRSLGYAYVNFHNAEHGERALQELNYTLIKGKPCRIMWSQRDPALRKTGTGNIFIKNLDPSIDNKALHDTFANFGNILSCKVVTDDNGESKGYGFVHYETKEQAEVAIREVNGMLLNDKKVFVGHHVSKKERQSKTEELKKTFTNVYVKNIDPSVTDNDLEEKFSPFGPVTSCTVSLDATAQSRGFGFVNFERHDDAARAVEELNDTDWIGKKLVVCRAQKKGEREEELRRKYEAARQEKLNKYQGINLYVKNLEDDVDDDRLRQEFSPYGMITSTKVMRDDKGNSKGFGFVCFSSPDEATKAVTEMQGRMFGNKPIYVSLAQRKDVRRNQLEQQAVQRQLRMQQAEGMPAPIYGGAPMYYVPQPGFPQPSRGFIPNQPGMQPARPRWNPGRPQQGPMAGMPVPPPQGYPGAPPPVHMGYPVGPNAGPPRPPRPPRQGNRGGSQQRGQLQRAGNRGQRGGDGQGVVGGPLASLEAENSGVGPTVGPDGIPLLTAAALAAAAPEAQKQMLGESLYPLIAVRRPELAGKITGMLLEMDNGELLHLVESPEALEVKIAEAVAVLESHTTE